MSKKEQAIQSPIRDGYDYDLVNELPKLFIKDYLEKEKEALREAIDFFIDTVQSGNDAAVKYRMHLNACFGNITKMSEKDFKPNSFGMFRTFKELINKEFFEIAKRRYHLRDILFNDEVVELDIVGAPELWQDLCAIRYLYSYDPDSYVEGYGYTSEYYKTSYIRFNDFLTLMESKGFKKENITIADNIPALGTEILIKHHLIMFIDRKQKDVPKM